MYISENNSKKLLIPFNYQRILERLHFSVIPISHIEIYPNMHEMSKKMPQFMDRLFQGR